MYIQKTETLTLHGPKLHGNINKYLHLKSKLKCDKKKIIAGDIASL